MAYEPAFYIVTQTDRLHIAAQIITYGREVYEDTSQFKTANMSIQDNTCRVGGPGKRINLRGLERENSAEYKPLAPRWYYHHHRGNS